MSQEKIDKRKQSKGDMLHNTKKHMKMTTLIVALVLVAAGAFASVVSYHQGYTKGEKDGEIHVLLVADVYQCSRVDFAGSGSHHESVGRCESHRRVDRTAVGDGRNRGAVADMAGYDA